MALFQLTISVILPVFLVIGLGFVLDRCFTLDLRTLSRLSFHAFIPALLFVKMLEVELAGTTILAIAGFSLAHWVFMALLAGALGTVRPFRDHRRVILLSSVFFNAGNFGIPVIAFAFGEHRLGVLAVVIVVQNFVTFTLGVGLLNRGHDSTLRSSLLGILRVPVNYAILLALVMRSLHWSLPPVLYGPVTHVANGLIPVALITLGAQLSRVRASRHLSSLSGVVLLRMVASPLCAAMLVRLFGFGEGLMPVLVVSAGFPVAVNVYVLCSEYEADAELASQCVFWTTLGSVITLPILLVLFGGG
jgi:predicted permease